MEKVLALVTESEATKCDLCNQLNSLLEGYMKVVGYATETGFKVPISADLVVFSSMEMYEISKDLVDPNCPIIIANRALNMSYIDKLFSIPNGTEVLVVNDLLSTAQEVINILIEVGVDQLSYHAYAPGETYDHQIQYAVTPAEVALIPKHIQNKIDLGARIIDITTIIEILTRLDLLDEKSRFISSKYVETIIRLNKRLSDSIVDATITNKYLNKVLNHVNDGLIAYDEKGTITVYNETSETIFGMRSAFVIGKNITQIIKDQSIRDFLLNPSVKDEIVGKIRDNQYIIDKMAFDKSQSYICTIKDTRKSLNFEKKVRQMMMKKGLVAKYHMSDIMGNSQAIRSTVEKAKKLATTDLSILIRGESGVGKEIFTSAIHNASHRNNGPFLAINFSALPEELAESELFGYEEGSFTGAKKGGKKGLFEEANGGTIFLDEIGDISPRIQARLLRVLQEKEIRRIGGAEIIPIDVRVIAATNRDLVKMCKEGQFREDLYHRLRKLYLKIPPLREHIEDLDELISHFIRLSGGKELSFSAEVFNMLCTNPWTGNVRELQNLVDYFQAINIDQEIQITDLPDDYFESLNIDMMNFNQCPQHLTVRVTESKFNPLLLGISNLTVEDKLILKIIGEANLNGSGIGRKGVSEIAKNSQVDLTDNRVRLKANRLMSKGLISIEPGRCGMKLTEQGFNWFNKLQR